METESEPNEQNGLVKQLLDPNFRLNIDGLLDSVIALLKDCNYSTLKQNRNIENFISRNEDVIKTLAASRIKFDDFKTIKLIGQGSFGEVLLVRNKQNNQVYAMKILDKDKARRSASFWEEREIMAHARDIASEWIVQLHCAFQDHRFLCMVMEFLPGGDLLSFMTIREFISEEEDFKTTVSNIPEVWAQFYAAELVLALDAIHSLGYIHHDVKPNNMLITKNGHIKLADFGTCLRMDIDQTARFTMPCGWLPNYISPEMLKSEGTEGVYGTETDWWSVGVVIYEMLFGKTPFYADTPEKVRKRVMDHNSELKFPSEVNQPAKDIISRFLSDRDKRLGCDGINEIKSHPFFQNNAWTFDTIREVQPPFVPELNGDEDTRYFEDVEPDPKPNFESYKIPEAFTGDQLPFIGFTYSNEFGPLETLRKWQESADLIAGFVHSSTNGELVPSDQSSANALLEELRRKLGISQRQIFELTRQLENERLKQTRQLAASRAQDEQLATSKAKIQELTFELKVETGNKSGCMRLLEEALAKKEVYEDRLRNVEVELTESKERFQQMVEVDQRAKTKEAEMLDTIRQQEDLLRKHSHGAISQEPVSSTTGSVSPSMTSAVTATSPTFSAAADAGSAGADPRIYTRKNLKFHSIYHFSCLFIKTFLAVEKLLQQEKSIFINH